MRTYVRNTFIVLGYILKYYIYHQYYLRLIIKYVISIIYITLLILLFEQRSCPNPVHFGTVYTRSVLCFVFQLIG